MAEYDKSKENVSMQISIAKGFDVLGETMQISTNMYHGMTQEQMIEKMNDVYAILADRTKTNNEVHNQINNKGDLKSIKGGKN